MISTTGKNRWTRLATAGAMAVILLALFLALLPAAVGAQQQEPGYREHVVRPGETLFGIAARYGVSVDAIVDANDIDDPTLIVTGQSLRIPAAEDQVGRVYVVQRGDSLGAIAARFDVTVEDLVLANDLPNADTIFAGRRLFIPVIEEVGEVEATDEAEEAQEADATALPEPSSDQAPSSPAGRPEAEPARTTACPAGCEALSIVSPSPGMTVTNPIVVSGRGIAPEQSLVIRVLNATGAEIGLGYGVITGTAGQPGPYTGTVTYTVPAASQPGRIQVYSLGQRDGAIEHLNSVEVTLQGAGLDTALEQLKSAVEAEDYEALAELMADSFLLSFYRSEALALEPDQGIAQLRDNYLGPGLVIVDLSVNARVLLGNGAGIPPEASHVVYSTGWGENRADDAFLFTVPDDERGTRWGGMLYVFEALRDYGEQ